MRKIYSNKTWLYQNQLNIVAELDSHGNVEARFVYGTKGHVPDYMVKNGVTYRFITDHLGSVRMVVEVASGAIVQYICYDEFGNVLNDTNPGFQPFGYAGGLYDFHTGLVRFGVRDYEARVGRWMAKDPVGFYSGQTNHYLYVNNNPINNLDILGLWKYGQNAGSDPNETTKAAIDCFDKCAKEETKDTTKECIVTAAKETGHAKGSAHETGEAFDLGKNSNPWLTRDIAKKCYEKCFTISTSWACEEKTCFHFQTRPGAGGATGFAEGVK